MDLRIRINLIYSPCIKRHNNPKMLILFFLLSFLSFFLFFFPFFQLPYFCQKGLSPMADLMPGGGVEATVFILEGLPRCSTPPILTHIFRIWHRF